MSGLNFYLDQLLQPVVTIRWNPGGTLDDHKHVNVLSRDAVRIRQMKDTNSCQLYLVGDRSDPWEGEVADVARRSDICCSR